MTPLEQRRTSAKGTSIRIEAGPNMAGLATTKGFAHTGCARMHNQAEREAAAGRLSALWNLAVARKWTNEDIEQMLGEAENG